MSDSDNITNLPGEGDVVTKTYKRVREQCAECGEPATVKHSFLSEDARRDPASSAFGRDDCSFCSDHDEFACDECKRVVEREWCPDGMRWSSTCYLSDKNARSFLDWVEV